MKKKWLGQWQANFVAGLVVVMPAVISVAVVLWLFGTVADFTDKLLFFMPRSLTHQADGAGPLHWYWSVFAFLLTLTLICLVGVAARHYVGRKMIEFGENILLRVPLLNKIYLALKQINEAFATSKKSAFKTVVIVQFPRQGIYSIGFITSEQHAEVQAKTKEQVVCVFVPTTPNPTTGFLVLVPESEIVKLEMSVADAIKFIISLGTVSPEFPQGARAPAAVAAPSAPPRP